MAKVKRKAGGGKMPALKGRQVIKTVGGEASGIADRSVRGFGGGKLTDRGIKK
jgi:hypothetical protein